MIVGTTGAHNGGDSTHRPEEDSGSGEWTGSPPPTGGVGDSLAPPVGRAGNLSMPMNRGNFRYTGFVEFVVIVNGLLLMAIASFFVLESGKCDSASNDTSCCSVFPCYQQRFWGFFFMTFGLLLAISHVLCAGGDCLSSSGGSGLHRRGSNRGGDQASRRNSVL